MIDNFSTNSFLVETNWQSKRMPTIYASYNYSYTMFTWSVSVMNLAKKLALRFGKNMIKQGGGVGEWTVTSTSMIG